MPPTEPSALRERLRRTLRDALRARDAVAAGALRAAIAAIDNAEAVAVEPEGWPGGRSARRVWAPPR